MQSSGIFVASTVAIALIALSLPNVVESKTSTKGNVFCHCRFQGSFEVEHDAELEAEISPSPDSNLSAVQAHVPVGNFPHHRRVVVSNTDQGATVILMDKTGQVRHGKIRVKTTSQPQHEPPKKPRDPDPSCTHWVDLVSRMLFPASYTTFLVLFWRQFVQQLPI